VLAIKNAVQTFLISHLATKMSTSQNKGETQVKIKGIISLWKTFEGKPCPTL
jgi:hypothetical protein